MTKREIALALIRREAQEHGDLTLIALLAAQEHRIGYAAMIEAARDGLRRRTKQLRSRHDNPHDRLTLS